MASVSVPQANSRFRPGTWGKSRWKLGTFGRAAAFSFTRPRILEHWAMPVPSRPTNEQGASRANWPPPSPGGAGFLGGGLLLALAQRGHRWFAVDALLRDSGANGRLL